MSDGGKGNTICPEGAVIATVTPGERLGGLVHIILKKAGESTVQGSIPCSLTTYIMEVSELGNFFNAGIIVGVLMIAFVFTLYYLLFVNKKTKI